MSGPGRYPWLRPACLAAGATFAVGVSLLWEAVPPNLKTQGLVLLLAGSAGVGGWVGFYAKRRADKADRWEQGLCRGCGYDIRASQDRCPECGRPFRFRTGWGRKGRNGKA